jgi:glycosyltransferase involved in cell wall biosynthesis
MGHHTEILTYGWKDDTDYTVEKGALIKRYIYENIPVIAIRHLQVPDDKFFTLNIHDETLEPLLNSIISKTRYDLLHVAHPFRIGTSIQTSISHDIPVVLTLTDFWMICPRAIAITQDNTLCHSSEKGMKCIAECFSEKDSPAILSRINAAKEILQTVNITVTSTFFLRSILMLNYPDSNIKVIRFGKDYKNVRKNSRIYSKDSQLTIGFLSTLQPHKGAHILLEANNLFKSDKIKIKIYGHYFDHSNYYFQLLQIAKRKNVEFCKSYLYQDFPKILDELDLVIVPSLWWENSPLVLLRALAHNVPVIVSRLGGLTEIIKHGKNGFVFEVGDAKSLAAVLKKIDADPRILNKIKSQIQSPPRIEEEAFEYEMVYNELTQNLTKGEMPLPNA